MQKRHSYPFDKNYHCFAPRPPPSKFPSILSFLKLFTIASLLLSLAYIVNLWMQENQDLKCQFEEIKTAMALKEVEANKLKLIQQTENENVQKKIESLINAISVYTDRKKMIEDEKSNLTVYIESNLELLKNDLLYSVQNYLLSFYNEIITKDIYKEQQIISESIQRVETLIFKVADDMKPFEEKFNVLNIADIGLGAKIIKYDIENRTWTTSNYLYHTNFLYKFDQFLNVNLLITTNNDFMKCYQADGAKGIITIQLNSPKKIFGFSYEHKLNTEGDFDAIKVFQVYGLLDINGNDPLENYEGDGILNGYYMGSYYFTAGKMGMGLWGKDIGKQNFWKVDDGNRFKQYFICSHKNCEQHKFRTLRIEYENYGERRWTCLYKFEVFIKRMD